MGYTGNPRRNHGLSTAHGPSYFSTTPISPALWPITTSLRWLPESKVFRETTLDNGDQVSISASHELVEMLVDPAPT